MFIRKRVRKLKKGKESITYQMIESFREKGKIKQRIVSMGNCSSPEEFLKQNIKYLEVLERQLKIPLSEYKELKSAFGVCIVEVPMIKKKAEKKRGKLVKRYKKQKSKLAKLDRVVSKWKIKNT